MKKSILFILILSGILSASCSRNSKDNTVSCSNTNLMWQDNADVRDKALKKTWENAITYCRDLTFADYYNWRLPNIRELKTIIDRTKHGLTIKDGFVNSIDDFYWSSTTSHNETTKAWFVYFNNSNAGSDFKTQELYVRCVRNENKK